MRATAERLVKRASARGATFGETAFRLVAEGEVLATFRAPSPKNKTTPSPNAKATTAGTTTTTTIRGDDAAPYFGAEAFGIDPAEGFVVDAVAITACVTWELSPADAARLADEYPALVERLRRSRDDDDDDSESRETFR